MCTLAAPSSRVQKCLRSFLFPKGPALLCLLELLAEAGKEQQNATQLLPPPGPGLVRELSAALRCAGREAQQCTDRDGNIP